LSFLRDAIDEVMKKRPDMLDVRLLVTGSRLVTNSLGVNNYLDGLKIGCNQAGMTISEMITGGARTGADRLAFLWAEREGIVNNVFLVPSSDWQKWGGMAGMMRNQRMIDEGKPQFAAAFFQVGAANRGTKDCVARLRTAKITVFELWVTEVGDVVEKDFSE